MMRLVSVATWKNLVISLEDMVGEGIEAGNTVSGDGDAMGLSGVLVMKGSVANGSASSVGGTRVSVSDAGGVAGDGGRGTSVAGSLGLRVP